MQPTPQQRPASYPAPPVYTQPAQVVYVAPTKTNGLAVAGMVLGILWLYWVGSILAVIFGHVALSQIKRNPNQGGRGMAIAAVVLGWIGVAILAIVILAAIGASSNGSGY